MLSMKTFFFLLTAGKFWVIGFISSNQFCPTNFDYRISSHKPAPKRAEGEKFDVLIASSETSLEEPRLHGTLQT